MEYSGGERKGEWKRGEKRGKERTRLERRGEGTRQEARRRREVKRGKQFLSDRWGRRGGERRRWQDDSSDLDTDSVCVFCVCVCVWCVWCVCVRVCVCSKGESKVRLIATTDVCLAVSLTHRHAHTLLQELRGKKNSLGVCSSTSCLTCDRYTKPLYMSWVLGFCVDTTSYCGHTLKISWNKITYGILTIFSYHWHFTRFPFFVSCQKCIQVLVYVKSWILNQLSVGFYLWI